VARDALVVDGYNVVRSTPKYRALVDDDLNDPGLHDVYVRARSALLADVAAFAQGSYDDPTVVFDGFGNPDPERTTRRTAGVSVVFSPSGVEADQVIERLVAQLRGAGRRVTVVTSDAGVQSTVFGDGVTRLSARMFGNEAQSMNEAIADLRVAPHTGGPVRATVADRVPTDVRLRLKQMTLPRTRGTSPTSKS
jgi:hypothetical protein